MHWKQFFFILFLAPALVACKESSKPQEEVYDYRDERYQDTYSRYMRKTGLDYLIITPQAIQDSLGLASIPDGLGYGRMDIDRRDLLEKGSPKNKLKTHQEILHYFNTRPYDSQKYEPCTDENEENLFCLRSVRFPKHGQIYYYMPDGLKQIDYIDHPIFFDCHPLGEERKCNLSNRPNNPYNLDVYIQFRNPQNFFYIMPYVEKHFYETTGEHIWQTLPNKSQ